MFTRLLTHRLTFHGAVGQKTIALQAFASIRLAALSIDAGFLANRLAAVGRRSVCHLIAVVACALVGRNTLAILTRRPATGHAQIPELSILKTVPALAGIGLHAIAINAIRQTHRVTNTVGAFAQTVALIAAANASRSANAIDTFLRAVRLTSARQPFLFVARITATNAGGDTFAMTAIEITNWFAEKGILWIKSVAHKTSAGIWSCASAM